MGTTQPLALAIRHISFEDLGILEPVLVDLGYQVQYWDAGIETIATLENSDPALLIVLGGPIGANDDALYPFLSAEREKMRQHIQAGKPCLGICLGAQLAAQVLGGEVKPGAGVEIGWAPLELTPAGETSLLAPLAGSPVLHWHGDYFTIPEGATHLASTAHCAQQAFGWKPSVQSSTDPFQVLALQFHLEAAATNIDRWLIGHAHELASNNCDVAKIRAAAAECGPKLKQLGQQIIATWLAQWVTPQLSETIEPRAAE